ncbi:MAG: hypothetical protein H0W50_06750 [Parachlamydiaceae bacterium]|nr:hypothetical protein [Parachlamydiaceae bacterium]
MEDSGSICFNPGQPLEDYDYDDRIFNNLDENCQVIREFQNNGKKNFKTE